MTYQEKLAEIKKLTQELLKNPEYDDENEEHLAQADALNEIVETIEAYQD